MRIEHAALYVNDLEGARAFFETYFGAVPNDGYHNPKTGLRTYFLTFGEGDAEGAAARLRSSRVPALRTSRKAPCEPAGRTWHFPWGLKARSTN